MPVIMKRLHKIKGDYTEEQKEILQGLIDMFRLSIADDDPDKNILNKKTNQYSDDRILAFLLRAVSDINGTPPRTEFDVFYYVRNIDDTILVDGAMVFALMSEGILQLRNQTNFSDSGLTISMFDKTQGYQGWAAFIMQNYMSSKESIKRTILSRHMPNMFFGISSEFDYYNPYRGITEW